MLFGNKNNRPAIRSTMQCALDRDVNAVAVLEVDACDTLQADEQNAAAHQTLFAARKPGNAMTFQVDLLEGWARA